MSLGIVAKVITRYPQQPRTYVVELSGIVFGLKAALSIAKPVPGFSYHIEYLKTTIPQPSNGLNLCVVLPGHSLEMAKYYS
ncbi:MAG: hypothetical protein B6D64_06155 [Bacteroidetes bacterium 4484_276]|nr:MAG: hypothetical protein B6D64_06155 [Bacteroidetes bacterium 4484_276]OYT14323.1 MAG: hypothetical protein B6I19_00525 [Bacteroidetes bacterium 4572_114]